MKGNLRLKIDWASLIVGSKFTVFALFYFVREGNFPSSFRGAYIWRGDITEGFFALPVLGAYNWRGLFSEFYGTLYEGVPPGAQRPLKTVNQRDRTWLRGDKKVNK